MNDVRGKKVTVLGMGVSGVETARFLRARGARVFLSEGRSTERTERTRAELLREGFELEVGAHSEERLREADWIVISPGISPRTPVYQSVLETGRPVVSEIEVAHWFCEMPSVGVTGTNGKTTVTTLIAKMLSACARPAVSCGNIGNPFIAEVDRINRERLTPVIELSSFQLSHIQTFRPHTAVLLNLDPDHLDWHKDTEEYYEAKFSIFRNQGAEDFAVVNHEDAAVQARLERIPSRVVYFNVPSECHPNPNIDALLAVAGVFGISRPRAVEALSDFKGIEHRLEEVPASDGRRYINDSKSTNISSLVWALERMERPVVLILGGKNKGGDFTRLRDLFRKKVKEAVLIGEATPEIEPALQGTVPYVKAATLRDALREARNRTGAGETVLFSPGCASFDMFINYKDRGEQFKKLSLEISQTCPQTVTACSSSR
jgi:UDP-N-acetylmuramoylalanine--D-glutamate ligase